MMWAYRQNKLTARSAVVASARGSRLRPGAGASARMSPILPAAMLMLCVSILCVCCSGASAHQGHVFSAAFGSAGSGDGELLAPSDVAVDEARGLAYVSDTGNDRVEVFERSPGGEYTYASQFAVRDPGPIAVDNSSSASDPTRGEVYIAGAGDREEAEERERNTLYVYSPTAGEVTHKVQSFKFKEKGGEELEEEFEENISGVAVDANGVLWVYWEEQGLIDGFVKGLTGSGASRLEWQPGLRRSMEERFECFARPAFAVSPDATAFYVGYERRNGAEECPGEDPERVADPTVLAKLDDGQPSPHTQIAEVDRRDTTGAAVDSAGGDVFLDTVTSVADYAPDGVLAQRFGTGQMTSGSGIAIDDSTGEVLVADSSEDRVVVFGLKGTPGKPLIDSVSSQNLSPSSAELRAQIDPRGQETQYQFQYGTSDCSQDPGACVDLPTASIPAGFGDVDVSVQVHGLAPATAYYFRVLASNTLGPAEGTSQGTFTTLPSPSVLPDGRGWEMVSPTQKHGSTIEMISYLRSGSIQTSLDGNRLVWLAAGPVVSEPEGNRSFELSQLMSVREPNGWSTTSLETPHTKGWGLLLPSPSEYHFFTPDLSAGLLEPTEYDLGKTEGVIEHPALSPEASEKTMYVRGSLPSAPGEYSPLVNAQNDEAGTKFGGSLDFLGATSDLSHVVFHSKVGLTAADPSAAGLYMFQQGEPLSLISRLPDGTPAEDGGFTEPSLGAAEGLNTRGAISSNGQRVFWTDGAGTGLYMRDTVLGQTIRLNSAQGHGAIEPGPEGGEVPEPPAELSEREARFQSATPDGTKVFFTDTARLTEDSTQEPTGEESPADLYEFELTSQNPLRGRLTDITAGAAGSSGDVLNVIPGTSTDGSTVYFVANAALAPGAVPGRCARNPEGGEESPPGATCNLYVSEEDSAHPGQRQTRFIAALSAEDGADWGASASSKITPLQSNLSLVSSSISPDGRYLAFMSQQQLTGYDNRDSSSGEPDEEVYLYDAATGRLACVSCNPADPGGEGGGWQRPHGVLDTELAGEGVGLLIDRPEIWSGRWLAGSLPGYGYNRDGKSQPAALYQPRYLFDSGRLFFNSSDALVAGDQNGKADVYEYEPQNVGSCQHTGGCIGLISSGTSNRESAFLDSSENGDDVFFLTASQLVAPDTDEAIDIYDAHVCTQSSPCLQYRVTPPPDCQTSEECRTASSSPSGSQPAATSIYTGPGNPTSPPKQTVGAAKAGKPIARLTRAQKLSKALKACRKQHAHSRKKRGRCEAQARKKYGPHETKKKKKATHAASRKLDHSGGRR